MCLFLGEIEVTADLHCLTDVTLVGCHELDPAVPVSLFVPVRK